MKSENKRNFYYSHTRINFPLRGGHIFQQTITICEHIQDIIKINVLTKFHEDLTINVTFRELTRKMPRRGRAMQPTGTIFKIIQDIIGTNLLTKFHTYKTINEASRKMPFPWQPYIIGTNLLIKFHEDQTINVASRVLTRFYYRMGAMFFNQLAPFSLIRDIIGRNFLTNVHEDRTSNVASRVFTRKQEGHDGPESLT
ncbi:hypothetical protein DPMN_074104 [Dreissena polymorpha]|uniref:Uncharacterized protein n=1 Tax=Dreissena polymorpha TaxID=45954 RepID=A0A9D4BDR9_DREPO|nr:hypothetical protein DPMN_074104 [Dreissena polymorpha]